MSDADKIWFVYLTDHHEGPFTAAEVADKLRQGQVTRQSLGWKDGMAEWVAIESIPELAAALDGGQAAPAAATASAGGGGGEEGFSLAQLLASQQQSGGASAAPAAASAPVQEDPSLTGATSVLSQMVGAVHNNNPVGTGSLSIDVATGTLGGGQGQAAPAPQEAPVGDDDEVWTMKVGQQVTGLYTYNRLIELAGSGDVPADARFWRPGWADFQSLAKLPEVAASRRAKPAGPSPGLSTGLKTGPGMTRPAGLAPITAAANVGDDDPTDPSINTASLNTKPGILGKIKSLFSRKKKAPAAAAAPAAATATKGVVGGKKATASKSGGSSLVKKIILPVVILALAGGGGAAYFFLFSSPIPSSLDVLPDDLEAMKNVVKEPAEGGGKFHLAPAKGTEESPADPTSPKFYVATNLAEGATVTLQLVGQPGTLVNRMSFEKSFSATVNGQKMAVFEQVQDDGKPIPMGEYDLKVSADGAEMLVVSKFLGGNKSAAYSDRLKKYKDKIQGEYDKDMQEFRELIETIKTTHADLAKSLDEYSKGWSVVSNRTKIVTDWRTMAATTNALLTQLDQKAKAKAANTSPATYHPKALQELVTLIAQLQQMVQIQSQRVSEQPPTADITQLDGLVRASIASMEQWLTQTLVKSPQDVLSGAAASPIAPAASSAVNSVSPISPAPVGSTTAPVAPTSPSPASPVSPVSPATPAVPVSP